MNSSVTELVLSFSKLVPVGIAIFGGGSVLVMIVPFGPTTPITGTSVLDDL